jgi:hypothetical protein
MQTVKANLQQTVLVFKVKRLIPVKFDGQTTLVTL